MSHFGDENYELAKMEAQLEEAEDKEIINSVVEGDKGEPMKETNGLPEAPASVTYTIQSKEGFNALFTVRDTSGTSLLEKMIIIETKLTNLGYIPQIKRGEKKPVETVQDRKCPTCGSELVYQLKKDGKKFIKCSKQKYDFTTKTASGCQFVEWPKE